MTKGGHGSAPDRNDTGGGWETKVEHGSASVRWEGVPEWAGQPRASIAVTNLYFTKLTHIISNRKVKTVVKGKNVGYGSTCECLVQVLWFSKNAHKNCF